MLPESTGLCGCRLNYLVCLMHYEEEQVIHLIACH